MGEFGGSEFFSLNDNLRIEKSFRTNIRDNFGETIVIREYTIKERDFRK